MPSPASATSSAIHAPGGSSEDATRPDLVGTVRGLDGQALRATVFIHTAAPKTGTSSLCPSCYPDCRKRESTDEQGRFTMASLDPELTFRIVVVAQGHSPRVVGGVDPAAGPLDVVLERFPEDHASPERSIRGRVVDARDNPVEGALIHSEGMFMSDGTGRWGYLEGVDALAVTDSAGEFVLGAEVPFAGLHVRVEARGLAPRNFLQLGKGADRHILRLDEGGMVTGRVVLDGRPLAGARMGAVPVDRRVETFVGTFEIATDEDGAFAFVNLPANTEFHVYGLMESFKTLGATATSRVRTGATGSTVDLGDVEVGPSHRLSGRVVLADDGALPPGTRLLVSRGDAWDSMILVPDPSGRFETAGLPTGLYSLTIRLNGYEVSARNLSADLLNPGSLVGRVERDVTDLVLLLEPGSGRPRDRGETMEWADRPENRPLQGAEGTPDTSNLRAVSGRVVDADTGVAVAEFRVTAGKDLGGGTRGWEFARTTQGRGGEFSHLVDVRWKEPRLRVDAPGYIPAVSEPVRPGSGERVDIRLRRGVGPGGIVLHPDGTPAAGVRVALLCAHNQIVSVSPTGEIFDGSGQTQTRVTDSAGRFEFEPDVQMHAILAVAERGFSWVRLEGDVASITLQPWGRIEGVLWQEGRPWPNERLHLSTGQPRRTAEPWFGGKGYYLTGSAVTDNAGRFTFERVPAGRNVVVQSVPAPAIGPGTFTSRELRSVEVPAGETVTLEISTPSQPHGR